MSAAELAEMVYRAVQHLNSPDWLDEPDCWVEIDLPVNEESSQS